MRILVCLDASTAAKYQATIETAGVFCLIEADLRESLPIDLPAGTGNSVEATSSVPLAVVRGDDVVAPSIDNANKVDPPPATSKSNKRGRKKTTKTASTILLAIGLLLMILAYSMDTSVQTGYGRVHNLSLANQQQTTLVFGGLLFLAGIVLLSVVKTKQTPEEEVEQAGARETREKQARETIRQVVDHFSKTADSRVGRTITGLLVGTCLAYIAKLYISYPALLLFFGSILYAFRPIPAIVAMRSLLGVNTAALALFSLHYFIAALVWTQEREWEFFDWTALMFLAILAVLSAGWYMHFTKVSRRLTLATD